MTLPRWIKRTLWTILALLLLLALLAGAGWLYLHPSVQRTNGIVNGQRGPRPLQVDVTSQRIFRPR